jgi:hypothetical protein
MHNGRNKKNNGIKRSCNNKDCTMRPKKNKKPKNKSKENKKNKMKPLKELNLNNPVVADKNKKTRIMMNRNRCSSLFSF